MHQHTIAAWALLLGLEIHTRRRVFENKLGPPVCAWGSSISSVFEEFELKFENVQKVAFIFLHFAPPRSCQTWPRARQTTVTAVMLMCDPRHSPQLLDCRNGIVWQTGFVLWRVGRAVYFEAVNL